MSASSVKVSFSSSLPGAASGFAAAGGADGGDDGDGPWRRKHIRDTTPIFDPDDDDDVDEEDEDDVDSAAGSSPTPPLGPRGRQNPQGVSEFCQVCHRGFASAKALRGHMRSHPQLTWRGVLPPSMRPGREREVADSLILLSGNGYVAERQKYPCKVCGREFETRQALGGHRASHKSREGCYARAAAGRPTQRIREQEDCAAESSAPATGPSTSRTSAGTSTSTRTALQNAAAAAVRVEQEFTSAVTRRRRMMRRGRRALDLNGMPHSSDGATGDGS